MNFRIKLLAALFQETDSKADFNINGLMFLLCSQYLENNIYYDFFVGLNGPVSAQLEEDKKQLIKKKFFDTTQPRYAKDLDFYEKVAIQSLKNDWIGKIVEVDEYIANKYPSVKSLEPIIDTKLFTIGYEGISIDKYINTLLKNRISLLCDVRKNAYSQKFGFSQKELKSVLTNAGISYIHISGLGIESEKRSNLNDPNDYYELFKEYDQNLCGKNVELKHLEALAKEHGHIAITCFEADHNHCHRGRIAKFLADNPVFSRIEHL